MDTLYNFMVPFGGWVIVGTVIAILVVVAILVLAQRNMYFMKVAQDTTAFITVGETLKQICPNVVCHRMSEMKDLEGRRWLVSEMKEEEILEAIFCDCLPGTAWFQKLLWKSFGVKFVGWLWPNTHRHTFNIRSRKRLLEGSDVKEDAPLKDRVVDSGESHKGDVDTVVDSLLFLVPRPVYLDGIQLAGDNSRINLLLLPIYQQVIPTLPVYSLKGDFFTQLDAAVEATVVHFFANYREDKTEKNPAGTPLTYQHWLKLAKAGENSPLETTLLNLNANKAYRSELAGLKKEKSDPKIGEGEEENELVRCLDELTHDRLKDAEIDLNEIPSGIIRRFGFALVSFRIVDWEPHKDTKALAEALLAKEIFLHQAEGVRQEAEGVRDAILARAKGESTRYRQLAEALIDKGVTPDVAAKVVETQLRTENIGGQSSKVTTYVESGAVNIGK